MLRYRAGTARRQARGWIAILPLVDGSIVRLARVTITTAAGEPMEGHPRPVDVPVDQPVGDDAPDAQLQAAVRELLARPRSDPPAPPSATAREDDESS